MKRYVFMLFHFTPLLLTILLTVVLLLASKAGLGGLIVAVIVSSWFFKYCFAVLDAAVAGDDELPVLSVEMINPVDEQRPLAFAALVAAEVMLAVVAGKHVGGWAAMLLVGIFGLSLPATIAVLGLTRNAFRAIWPPALVGFVRGLGPAYALLVMTMLACVGVGYLLWANAAPAWVGLFGGQMLFLFVAVLIGATIFEHRLELGIETRTLAERLREREAREHDRERHGMLDRAYAHFRVHRPQEGWQEIESWLRQQTHADEQLVEHQRLLDAASRWDDVRAADRLANDLVSLLLVQRQTGEALRVVEQRLASHPQFQLKQRAQRVRLAELAGAAGKRALQHQLTSQLVD